MTGRPVQHKTWNLAALWRLPVVGGFAWLKATPPFAADEAAAIGMLGSGLAPRVLASAPGRVILAEVPGEDLWAATDDQVTSMLGRFVVAQAMIARDASRGADADSGGVGSGRQGLGADLRDRRPRVLVVEVERLLDRLAGGELGAEEVARARGLNERWGALAECGLPDTFVHGDFHPGNWRGAPGEPPVVLDFADAYWGNPVQDGLRAIDYLPASRRDTARRAWISAWEEAAPGSRPDEALRLAEPLAHLAYAVRYQEFLDNIEESERIYHDGDPEAAIRHALAGLEHSGGS
ncbi:aminoglycoside phosphotransferase family protein [Cryptosporangium sp. NPDC048952]|uniref:aminoglycoside phosphotransferase family protein n=1 Tax=Cryptosporangium sp. NPDC048952 TaxID=3363961 RepID=UPI00371CF41B